MSALLVHFSRPNDTVEDQPPIDVKTFGPYDEFIQLTYHELRSGPDGDFVAWIDENGVWRVKDDQSATDPDYWYSDIVIAGATA